MTGARKSKSIRAVRQPNSTGGRIFLFIFGIPFFAMGAFFCWMMGLSPLLHSLASHDWVETSCVIVSSDVERHQSSDGDTYSIEISFRYTVDGKEYVSDTYNFNKSSSSGYKGKAQLVREFPVGSEHICWVNPDDSNQAVLNRNIPGIVFFTIPFSSIFMLVGLGLSAGALGLLPQRSKAKFNNKHKPAPAEPSGAAVLKPKTSGPGKVVGILLVSCFWNGISGVFVVIAVKSHLDGDPEWFLTFFLIPFVLIGIATVLALIHALLALANPKFKLMVNESSPSLGNEIQLEWRADKPLRRLRKLKILIEGQESATYRRGTDTVTDHSIFHQDVLVELDQPISQQQGSLTYQLPTDSMHSFDSGNNKIEWQLKVHGGIARYPDINDVYSITVRPHENAHR